MKLVTRFNRCQGLKNVNLYVRSPIHLQGVVVSSDFYRIYSRPLMTIIKDGDVYVPGMSGVYGGICRG
jgi:hypothetical protein